MLRSARTHGHLAQVTGSRPWIGGADEAGATSVWFAARRHSSLAWSVRYPAVT